MKSRIARTALGAALAFAIANPALAAKPAACTNVDGALPGSSLVYFTGEAITNIVNNPAPVDIAPNTLGTATIATTDHKIRLTCGIRGTLVNATQTTPTRIDAVFLSHAVCADHSQLDFNVQTTVTLTASPSATCPGGIGNVHEEGSILGSVGTVKGAVGSIQLNGISACGLQELDISGFLCLTAEQQRALKDLKNED